MDIRNLGNIANSVANKNSPVCIKHGDELYTVERIDFVEGVVQFVLGDVYKHEDILPDNVVPFS